MREVGVLAFSPFFFRVRLCFMTWGCERDVRIRAFLPFAITAKYSRGPIFLSLIEGGVLCFGCFSFCFGLEGVVGWCFWGGCGVLFVLFFLGWGGFFLLVWFFFGWVGVLGVVFFVFVLVCFFFCFGGFLLFWVGGVV